MSRFFFSQLVVNATFGIVLGIALWIVGIPHAALWGALGALARFVPYVGALGAGAAIAGFAAAVDPGWSLMFWSIGCFLVLEALVAHFVEPQVYGPQRGPRAFGRDRLRAVLGCDLGAAGPAALHAHDAVPRGGGPPYPGAGADHRRLRRNARAHGGPAPLPAGALGRAAEHRHGRAQVPAAQQLRSLV
ncbi:AI-2E family transporter [Ramlibacter terrae]|uniref:AI-2E family transporter n=1 Tax=Ramlibacter terrae TaxID=2732511 RepID=A0ABX6P779_9BURK|nr:AI-2E family transporter [Ramlibacter terrae]